ncbi:transcriptional regulator family: C2H2 zinc finger [Trichoderma harzianum]|nr:transcriptional regulator family: C2H2 zinc finger [Trichoderma harzianum]
MKAVHPGKFTDAQLNILAIRNARPTSSMFKPCPLCGNEEFDGNRADHVAGHLLLLALKSLPSYEEHIEEKKKLVLYQQPHLLISNTLSKSAVGQDSRNDSNFIVSTGRIQSSSVPKNEETTIRGSARGQQQHQRNEAIAQELQQWQERFNSQQSSSSTVHNSQQAATISPILEEQPAFQADLSPSYSKVGDDDIPIEYEGSETTVKHAYFSSSSPVPRSLDDPTEKHDSGRKGKEKGGEEEEDGDIEMDDVKLSLSSLPEYSGQKHVVFMDKDTEKWGERKASYHEQAVGKEGWQQGNAETSSDFHAHGRTPIIDITRDTEDPSEIFVCDLCNRRFHHYEHLKRHFRALHTLEDLFECNECGKKFSLRENFAQHARTHAADDIVIDDSSGVPNYGKVLFQIASEIPGSDSELSPEEGTRSKGTEKRKRSN